MTGTAGSPSDTLRAAIQAERSRRWKQVVQLYRLLLRQLESGPPMLLYEVHYHLGLALQQVGEPARAARCYTRAIDAVFIPKNGCRAGCSSNSCLMTPLHARRAFAHAQAGEKKAALRDAEYCVILDSKVFQNPDVYCIRALALNTRGQSEEALRDAERALQLSPNHVCALVLRGGLAVKQVSLEAEYVQRDSLNADQRRACAVNPDCHNFLNVLSFTHRSMQPFYERFLYSLSVPHTISEVPESADATSTASPSPNFAPSRSSTLRSLTPVYPASNNSFNSSSNLRSLKLISEEELLHRPAFRSGTPATRDAAYDVMQRRREYGKAVRDHAAKPTGRHGDDIQKRPEKELLPQTILKKTTIRVASANAATRSRLQSSKHVTERPSTSGQLKVFAKINLREAPRMYQRPWLGDKLIPADREEKEQHDYPPFR